MASAGSLIVIDYRPQRSCGQGNIFAPVCHSVHGGGGGGGIPQGTEAEPPPDQAHQPPQTRHTPRPDTPRPDTPQTRHPRPPGPGPPPRKQIPAYGLRAAGTHPTGMHSCWICSQSEIWLKVYCRVQEKC